MNVLSIVVTYNAEPWLSTCLGSLMASSVKTSIAVIDNASSDKTVEVIRDEYIEDIDYFFPLPENVGFGGAHNYIFSNISIEKYDFILLLNQDAAISENCLQILLEIAPLCPEVGVLSPIHYYSQGKMDRWFEKYYNNFTLERYVNGKANLRYVNFVNAAIWLLRANVLAEVGGFNPLFFHYGEDLNYCHRIQYEGYKVAVLDSAEAFHFRGQDATGLSRSSVSKMFYINQLAAISNPNNLFLVALIKAFIACSRKVLRELTKREFSEAKAVICSFVKLVYIIPSTYYYRTADRNLFHPTVFD